jgi:hypothetical protein
MEGMMGRVGARALWATGATLTCLLALGLGGCTQEAGADASAPSVISTGTSAVFETVAKAVPEFLELSALMGDVPVFGLDQLPNGMTVPSTWWPVVEQSAPPQGENGANNPRVVDGASREPEGQLILKCGDGWLDVIANFRGDLGDVSGEMVGSVAGRPAYLYELGGGWLVQWGYEGRWYGLFGRGVTRDVVTSTALNMTLVERY